MLATAVAVGATACGIIRGDYVVHTPRDVQFADGRVAFETALRTIREMGYATAHQDDARGFLQVEAKIPRRVRGSFITVQAFDDGHLRVSAAGRHVHGSEVLAELHEEVDEIASELAWRAAAAR